MAHTESVQDNSGLPTICISLSLDDDNSWLNLIRHVHVAQGAGNIVWAWGLPVHHLLPNLHLGPIAHTFWIKSKFVLFIYGISIFKTQKLTSRCRTVSELLFINRSVYHILYSVWSIYIHTYIHIHFLQSKLAKLLFCFFFCFYFFELSFSLEIIM